MKTRKSLLYTVLLVAGVLILVNLLADRFFVRLDLTKDKIYTLNKATKNILRNLDEPVTVTAYFSEKLPPLYTRLRKEFKNKLEEFASISKGKVMYEFIDPMDDEELERKAQENGISPVQIQVMEKDEQKAQKAYMGAVIKIGDNQEVLPLIQSETGMEYSLAKAIKKLTLGEKPTVGILQGHGEPGIQELQNVYYELESFYNVQTFYLSDTTDELSKYSTVMIIAPKDTMPKSHIDQLRNYVNNGNNLFIAINTVGLDESNQYGENIETGIPQWLQEYGITVNKDYVVDVECPVVTLQKQLQAGQIQIIPVKFYYYPQVVNFEDHPISGGIEQMTFTFISSISFNGDSTIKFTPLFKSSEKSGTKSYFSIMDVTRSWSDSDFRLSGITLGAAVENIGPNQSKMVVIGDGDFPVGDPRRGQINPENLNLCINSIDWLSDDTGLVGLRTKGASSRPIEELEESKITMIKTLNMVIPVLLIILVGIFRQIRNKNIQNKRREEGYV